MTAGGSPHPLPSSAAVHDGRPPGLPEVRLAASSTWLQPQFDQAADLSALVVRKALFVLLSRIVTGGISAKRSLSGATPEACFAVHLPAVAGSLQPASLRWPDGAWSGR
jgi:hypothetical protein